ncbi:MAG TPA: 2-dehydropantoate 2-reductase [Deltaproteobacteria bacterium]|nr:2-dehydropantoate 2-reductase [Deltaproteobacteria bacterium]
MSSIKTISIVGAGAMGSFYVSKFSDIDASSVSVIAGGKRSDRLKAEGIVVNGKQYMVPVVRPEDKTTPADLIIVAVKNHHLPEAIRDMAPRVGSSTIIISVMNGIDSEEQIGAVYGMDKMLYAVAVGIDALRNGNAMTYTTQGKLFFGEADNRILSDRVKRVQELFNRAEIIYETPEDMIRILWWKFMINVGINQTSAVLRAPYGIFQTSRDAQELMDSAMREVTAIAAAAEIDITDDDINHWYGFLSQLSPEGKTSMLQDVEAKRKTEVEMFAGKMMELGKRYGIPTPVNETLCRIIRVIERN